MAEIPAWFWETLDSARPNLQALASFLENTSRQTLIEFATFYREASQEACEYWNGPIVDDIPFSEDDTEDLCNWVVSQGKSVWERAIASRRSLEPIVRLYRENDGKASSTSWTTHVDNAEYLGYQAPEHIAFAIFRTRFADDLTDVLEERRGGCG